MSSEAPAPTVGRHRKVRADALENRERVLAAAREVFAESGLDALIPDIAARAGVGNGTVYRHFPSKEALIDAIIEAYWQHLDEILVQALASDDPWAGFTALLQGVLAAKDEQRVAHEILMALKPERPKSQVAGRIYEALIVLFRRAQESGSARRDIPAETMPLVLRSLGMAVKSSVELQVDWQPYMQVVLDGLRAAQPQTPILA